MSLFTRLKRWLLPAAANAALFLLGPAPASAEETSTDHQQLAIESIPLEESLELANQERALRTQRAMGVLFGWSLLNMGVGTAGYFLTDGPERYFHQMNAGWNVVNAAIAAMGWRNARRESAADFGLRETIEEAYFLERVLLLNIGLNVGYMATGAYLRERGLRLDDERLQGWGPSLLVQGGFLLLFDSTLFALQRRGTSQIMDHLSLSYSPHQGPGLTFQGTF